MDITFKPLCETDFPLLLTWLETQHVKAWWDQDVAWTPALIQEKFGDYVKGYKLVNGVSKKIHAYIICANNKPIGYIQIYNAYDFPRSKPLTGLPTSLAAFDILIGEKNYLNQGIGSKAIVQLLKKHSDSYTHAFADPESTNLAAIRAYEKAGFKKINEQPNTGETWMISNLIDESTSNIKEALIWITNIIQKHNIPFQIVGGLAAIAYGSKRPLADIDIEIPEDSFVKIQDEVSSYITFGPTQYKSEGWDLLLMTLNYKGQEIDLSGAYKTKIYSSNEKVWVTLDVDLSKVNHINIYGINLPVIRRDELIAYKKILSRPIDLQDLVSLEK